MSGASILLDPAYLGEVPLQGPPAELQGASDAFGAPIGRYPRMLELDEDTKSRLIQFLEHELQACWEEKQVLVEDWIQWQKDYWAKPAQKVKNFPFQRAANIVIPITAIAVETIYARLMNTLFSVKPFISVRPRSRQWVDVAPLIERWFQVEWEDENSLDGYKFCRESLLELIKLGTGVGKTGYARDIRKVNVDTPDGLEPRWVEIQNGATLDYVPVVNFLMRMHETDPQKATWVGEEHRNITWVQLKRFALTGRMYLDAIEQIKHWWAQSQSNESPAQKYEDAIYELDNTEPSWREVFNFQEIWLSFDVDKDGVDEEIVVDFHYDSRTLLSVRYNWYGGRRRPYRIGVYIPVEGRWAGIGVGKQNEQFQAMITAIHRQRIDAGTLANMGQIAVKKNSGYGPGEPIFPGKMWFLDDPQSDIREFHLSDPHHIANLNNEEAARAYSEKRTGVNEVVIGYPQTGTPPPATSELARLAEGNKKFDLVLKNVRRWYAQLVKDVISNFQLFGNRSRHWTILGEDGQLVEEFLMLPEEDIHTGAKIELTVTDSITNKDVEQQKWLSLFSVLTGHYDKVIERAFMLANLTRDAQMVQLLLLLGQKAIDASNIAIKRLLETYNVPDIDEFLILLNRRNARLADAIGGAAGAIPGGQGIGVQAGVAGANESPGVGFGGLRAGGALSFEQG